MSKLNLVDEPCSSESEVFRLQDMLTNGSLNCIEMTRHRVKFAEKMMQDKKASDFNDIAAFSMSMEEARKTIDEEFGNIDLDQWLNRLDECT